MHAEYHTCIYNTKLFIRKKGKQNTRTAR